MISAVIINFNEAQNLKRCLQNLRSFAQELVVVDLGSTDQSKEVAKEFNAKVFVHKSVPYVELIRNYAVSKALGEWILVLDPDEVAPLLLADKLREITKQSEIVAVNIPRKNIFFGKWIAHTNWWPDRHIRFFRKGKVKWSEKIHSYPEVFGKVLDLKAREDLAIAHFGYESISQFMERQNRYSKVEAENLFSEGIRFSWFNFFWKPTREFLVRFIRHGGFLDGFHGFALTYLMMIYQLQVAIKLWELERQDK